MPELNLRGMSGVLQDLRAQPLRTAIATVSMFIGVVAVVLTAVAGAVAQHGPRRRRSSRRLGRHRLPRALSGRAPDAGGRRR